MRAGRPPGECWSDWEPTPAASSAADRPAIHRADVVREVDGRGNDSAPVVRPRGRRRPRGGDATGGVRRPSSAAGENPKAPTRVVPVEAERHGDSGGGWADAGDILDRPPDTRRRHGRA